MRTKFRRLVVLMLFLVGIVLVHDARAATAGPPKLRGISYGPYRDGESPDQRVYPNIAEMKADLRLVSRATTSLRTYASTHSPGDIPELCEETGIDCYLGIWLDKDRDANAAEVAAAVEIASRHYSTLKAIIVGNEVLARGDLPLNELVAYIRSVKSQTDLPVTTADTWSQLLANPSLASEVDFVTVHIYGYWDGLAIENAAQYVVDKWQAVGTAFPGKKVVIGETGWPSDGLQQGMAVPSAANQAQFLHDFTSLAEVNDIDYFYFEMFDEKWKSIDEGTVGANWGIYQSNGKVKGANRKSLPPAARSGMRRPPWGMTPIPVSAPFVVYDDDRGADSAFFASGWMGDQAPIGLDVACTTGTHSGSTCICITYTPQPGPAGFSGIYWQYPPNNWGKYAGYSMKGGANALTFWARGANGGEKAIFKVGGIHSAGSRFKDSFVGSTGVVNLTADWQQYSIDLARKNLSSVLGGFCWVTNAEQNPHQAVIFVDDIRFEAPVHRPQP